MMSRPLAVSSVTLAFLVSCARPVPKQASIVQQQTAAQVVAISSAEGMKRLREAESLVDFSRLVSQFESQTNKMYCGPTTVAIVLNALRGDRLRSGALKLTADQTLLDQESRTKLPSKDYVPLFNRYTQNNVFWDASGKPLATKTKLQVMGDGGDVGLQLRQLEALFRAHGIKTELHVVDASATSQAIRDDLVKNLREPNDYVVINYYRPVLGQKGSGHISPVGAYHAASDSVLVLDVNPNTAEWVWINVADITASMRTLDTVENRGYILVSDMDGSN